MKPDDAVTFEELVSLLDGCLEDMWRIAEVSPDGEIGVRRGIMIQKLLDEIRAYFPKRLQSYIDANSFDTIHLTNADGAMLVGQARRMIDLWESRPEKSKMAG